MVNVPDTDMNPNINPYGAKNEIFGDENCCCVLMPIDNHDIDYGV